MAIDFENTVPGRSNKSNSSGSKSSNNGTSSSSEHGNSDKSNTSLNSQPSSDGMNNEPAQYSRDANEISKSSDTSSTGNDSMPKNDVASSDTVKNSSDIAKDTSAGDQAYNPQDYDFKNMPTRESTGAPESPAGDADPKELNDTINDRYQAAVDSNEANVQPNSLNTGGKNVKSDGNKPSSEKASDGKADTKSGGKSDASVGENVSPGNNAATDGALSGAKINGSGVANGLKNVGGKALQGSMNFLKNGAALITRGISKAAVAFGTSVKAMTLATVLGGSVGAFLFAGLVFGLFNDNRIVYDEEDDCAIVNDNYDANTNSAMDGLGDVDAIANAKDIYKALSADEIGFTDAAIAGMLSNAKRESGLNPKVYEGYYLDDSELQGYAFKDWDSYTKRLHLIYRRDGMSIIESAYTGTDGKKYPAFGYWQWTGCRTSKLMEFANEVDADETGSANGIHDNDGDGFSDRVYDTDVQLAFLLKENCKNGSIAVVDWGQDPIDNNGDKTNDPVACADWFCKHWEGSSQYELHHETAKDWYDMIRSEGWKSDTSYANSILAMANINLTGAGQAGMAAAVSNSGCPKPEADYSNFDNSSIAACAMSWAWPDGYPEYCDINDTSTKVNEWYQMTLCTSQYVMAHNIVNNGTDLYYSSCDRGAATAVHASGSDDGFPNGGASEIIRHMKESEKWVYIGQCTNDNKSKLQPGDILDSGEHVIVYVGGELAKKKFGKLQGFENATYSVVHSSLSSSAPPKSRGPRCDAEMYDFSGEFAIYRCIKPDGNNSKKKKLIGNADLTKYHDGSTKAKSVDTDASKWAGKTE